MRDSGKKMQKPQFLVVLDQKRPFWTAFGQNGQNGENYNKKRLEHFSRTYKP